MTKNAAVTGGAGFIGAYLVRSLIKSGYRVKVFDNFSRGDVRRLQDVINHIDFVQLDIRDEAELTKNLRNVDVMFHLAAINGTSNFYQKPDLVLDVGIRGALSVVSACINAGVGDLVVASSAEVYQEPDIVPTPEDINVKLPDTLNPRYSYGGSKIASELIAFNYGRNFFRKVQIFRPHNVYGPDMGAKHVIPQFLIRGQNLISRGEINYDFRIEGTGDETRAFAFVEDVVDGIILMYEKGQHRSIYNIGSDVETTILALLEVVGSFYKVKFKPILADLKYGGALRRCPDISKIKSIGYQNRTSLEEGVFKTGSWYAKNSNLFNLNELM